MARLGDKFSRHAQSLGSASPDLSAGAQRPTLTEIPIGQIEPDPDQPRRDLGDLQELAASIRELGVVQPIIVTVAGYERYRILAGERRFAASKLAGLSRIPAIVRSVEEHQRLELQLVENLHRKDLSPFEEAETYRRLIADFGLTHEGLGRRIGRAQVSVTETLKILELPERVRREALEGEGGARRVGKTVLLEIARRPPAEQAALWEQAKRGELTVEKARAVRLGGGKRKPEATPGAGKVPLFRYPIALQEQDARVTVEFAAARPRLEDVVAALEEALAIEKSRRQPYI